MKKALCITVLLSVIGIAVCASSETEERRFQERRKYDFPEARQGVAVDRESIYAIDTREIARYDKKSGRFLNRWRPTAAENIIHLDSGVVFEGKLYCGHSNYPAFPMSGSVEIWEAVTLRHIGSYSFGIRWGSCTWIDRHQGSWWAVFAHYDRFKAQSGTDVRYTTLVKFDDRWQPEESWMFPEEVLKRLGEMSNSGGSWGPDGRLYCTGHDAPELYVLRLPKAGSILELIEILPVNCQGQGLAWDRSDPLSLFTLRRSDRQVIHSQWQK